MKNLLVLSLALFSSISAFAFSIEGAYMLEMKIGDRIFHDLMILEQPDSVNAFSGDFIVPGAFVSKLQGKIQVEEAFSSITKLDIRFVASERNQSTKIRILARVEDPGRADSLDGRKVLAGEAYVEGETAHFGTFRALPIAGRETLIQLGVKEDQIRRPFEQLVYRMEVKNEERTLVDYASFQLSGPSTHPIVNTIISRPRYGTEAYEGQCHYRFRPDYYLFCDLEPVKKTERVFVFHYSLSTNGFDGSEFSGTLMDTKSGISLGSLNGEALFEVPERM